MKLIAYVNSVARKNENFLALISALSRKADANLILADTHMSVHTPSLSPILGQGYSIAGPQILEKEKEIVQNNLLKIKQNLNQGNLKVSTIVLEQPFENYLQSFDEQEAILSLVLKEHDSGFWNEFMGTDETELANKSMVPLLIVPSDVQPILPRKLLFVITEPGKAKNLESLLFFANTFGVDVHYLINANTYRTGQTSYLRKLEYDLNIRFSEMTGKVSFYEKNEFEEIDRILEDESPDWLGYQNIQYQGLLSGGKNFHKNHVILDADRPLLLI